MQETIKPEDIDVAQTVLLEFIKQIPDLYGREYLTFNIHQLTHLPSAVRDWGPMWGFSCFRFENQIGHIVSLVRGTKCVPLQICKTFLMKRFLPSLHDMYFSDYTVKVNKIYNRLTCTIYTRKKLVSVGEVHLYGAPKRRALYPNEVAAFVNTFGVEPKGGMYLFYHRLSYNSMYMTTIYLNNIRHADDVIQLANNEFGLLSQCIVGKFFCTCPANSCICPDSVLLFVNLLEITNRRALSINSQLSISSNRFFYDRVRNPATICIQPSQVARKCFRTLNNGRYIICVLAPTESD